MNRLLGVCMFVGAAAWSARGAEISTSGHIDRVTVYRGQALVGRVIPLQAGPGLHEVIVTDLPDAIVASSLYADGGEGVQVRSVRYRERAVEEDAREEVRAIEVKIEEIRRAQRDNERTAQLIAEQRAHLTQLEQFSGPTAMNELRAGVLNAETVRSLTAFIFEERRRLSDEELAQREQALELAARLEILERERGLVAGRSARTAREAVLFVESRGDGEIRLRYLVNGATWEPSYTVDTDASRTGVEVEYFAAIHQMSGEDWGDVQMTLSTATPSLAARAPTLEPLRVALTSGVPMPSGAEADSLRDSYRMRKMQAEQQREQFAGVRISGEAGQNQRLDRELNELSANLWVLEAASAGRMDRRELGEVDSGPGISVTYEVEQRTSLPSRADRQQVRIASLVMPGNFYKVAAPDLSSQVFDEAMVTNDSDVVLLAGPVSTHSDGRFVGYGDMPMVAAGESFIVGFGIDTSLRASRELVGRTESVQGGNRVAELTFALTLQNFGDRPADVRLMDRLPTSEGADIRVILSPDAESALSQDRDYQREARKKGILRWDVTVAPGAVGERTLVREFGVRIEHDRQMVLTGLPGAASGG